MFAQTLRGWLEANERSQSYLARKAALNENYLSMLLNGQRHPGPKALRKLENAMGLEAGALTSDPAPTAAE
jgi:transcriptional regulator with XRE-family HTH domain